MTTRTEKDSVNQMSSIQKLAAIQQLYVMAQQLKKAGLKAAHPDWSDQQLDKEVRRIFLYART
jgi:DNA-binding transcriptional regulator WhiA